jgi:small GTP-binding protein
MVQKKVCMLGAYRVGKTSLVRRFVASLFDEKYHATLGVKIDKKPVHVGDGRTANLVLWDVAGAEDHFTVPSSYLRGAHGCLLVIDGTRPETLDRALDLAAQFARDVGPAVPTVVVLNKADLTDDWKLDDDAALAKLAPLNCPVVRGSAKTGAGVEEAFKALAGRMLGAKD